MGKLRLKSVKPFALIIDNAKGNTEGKKAYLMDTIRARQARQVELNERQQSIVVGSLLGDAFLVRTTRGYAFRVNHSIDQSDYVDWKYGELEAFTNSPPRSSKRCYYFRTISHPYFEKLRLLFYREQQRMLPDCLEQWINPLTLAVWVMDDGAKDGGQLRINTQSFTFEENERLISVLKANLGITATINRDKDRFRLRVTAGSMPSVRQMLAPFIIPSMQYKLSL